MRLHVGKFHAEELADAVNRDLLGDINEFAAAIITLAGIALSVFVGQHAALCLQHRAGNDVFGGDQFDLVLLALQLFADRGENFRICLS